MLVSDYMDKNISEYSYNIHLFDLPFFLKRTEIIEVLYFNCTLIVFVDTVQT